MANFVEYTLSLQDKFSAKLHTIGLNNKKMVEEFTKVKAKADDVAQSFSQMGTSIHTLQKKIDLLKSERDLLPIGSLSTIRQYNSEINKLEGNVMKLQTLNGSKAKTLFKDALNGLPGLATNPLVLVGAGIGASVRKGMEADMQKSNILTLLRGDAEKAKSLYSDITKYGMKSPYEKTGLIEAQKTMMSFGLSSDFVFGKLKNIGDIALGDTNKMQSLALAFGQSSSAGKLNGQDLNQMINAGFNPLQTISERTGESMASLRKRMEKGGISAKELAQAFEWATDKQGQFYQGAENASKTMGGKWSNLMDSLSEMMLKVYDLVSPIMMPLISGMTIFFTSITEGFGWFIDKMNEGNPLIVGITIAVGAFASAWLIYSSYTAIAAFAQNKLTWAVIKTNLAFLGNPVVWVITEIIALMAVIAFLIYKIDGWGAAWKHTVTGAKLLWQTYTEYVKANFNLMINGIMIGIDKIKLGLYKFKEAMGMGDSSQNQKMIRQINSDVESRKKSIIDGYKKMASTATEAKNEFVKAGGSLKWNDKKTMGGLVADVKGKLGVSDIFNGTNKATAQNTAQNLGGAGGGLDAGSKSIASGGTRPTNITINLNREMVGQITIHPLTMTQGANEVRDEMMKTLSQILNSSNRMAIE